MSSLQATWNGKIISPALPHADKLHSRLRPLSAPFLFRTSGDSHSQAGSTRDMCWYSHLNDNPLRAPTAWLCNGYIIGQCGTLWSKGSANFTVATWHETTWRKRRDEDENFDKQWQILEISICTVGITNITKFSYHLLHWPTLAF